MMNIKIIGILCWVILLSGCSTTRPPLPSDHSTLGSIEFLDSTSRYWGDEDPIELEEITLLVREQILAHDPAELNQPQYFLALSGGGQNGAFGAGILNGWSAKGDRPSFRFVTGISTGALIAPFAFLGSDYDRELKEMYTLHSTKQILKKSIMSGLFFGGEAIGDSKPLLGLIKKFLDNEAIERMAVEYKKGRRLFIGTTNIDALRPVIWDLGAIAASNHPDKEDVIHRVILASASIPGVFPPVLFDVSKGDIQYNEIHVDGGIGNQIFISPASVSIKPILDEIGFTQSGAIYMIRNNMSRPEWEPVKPTAISLTTASISGLIQNQGNTNQYVIYLQSQIDGMGCYSAEIPSSFKFESKEAFDKDYMAELYNLGYEQAKNGHPWQDRLERFTH